MGTLLSLLSNPHAQALPASLLQHHGARVPRSEAASTAAGGDDGTRHAKALAHYLEQAREAQLQADMRAELAAADRLLRMALNLLPTAAKLQLGQQAEAAGLIGPSGGTIRAHERAAVLQRSQPACGRASA